MSSTSLKSSNITILANKPTAKANAKILAPKPTRSKGVFKDILPKIVKFIRDRADHFVIYIAAISIITLFIWYYNLDKQLAVQTGISDTRIEFLEKKFSESESIAEGEAASTRADKKFTKPYHN